MKICFAFLAATWLIGGSLVAAPVDVPGVEFVRTVGGIDEYRLSSNDLTILLAPDHTVPTVTFMTTYKVGSRFEASGSTGATHMLEHLMFKGSPQYNKHDGTDADRQLERLGAQINATTWKDRTNYFGNLPSQHLELQIRVEADRMRNAWLREEDRETEMTVVRNEFERDANNPFRTLSTEIWAAAFQAHPYGVPTLGWLSDIENVPIEKLREFRDRFYWPNNAVATVAGDFEPAHALALIEQHFGPIGRSPHPIPKIYTQEPQQLGPRRLVLRRGAQLGVIGLAYKAPRGANADARALDVLQSILYRGKTSRLYRGLTDQSLATECRVIFELLHDPGLFEIYVFLAPGAEHQAVEDRLLEIIDDVRRKGVSKAEVARAIAQLEAETAYGRDGPLGVARELNEWIAMGDWTFYESFLEGIRAVTPDDVLRVARRYLDDDFSTTGWFVPVVGRDVMSGDADNTALPAALMELPGPQYFRTPGTVVQPEETDLNRTLAASAPVPGLAPERHYAGDVQHQNIHGIDAYTLRTGLKDVVTITGSLPAGDVFNPRNNSAIAHLTTALLDAGTRRRDKFELAGELERVGATIDFRADDHRSGFTARCLKKDLRLVLSLLAEQLREPTFDADELEKVKLQRLGELRRADENVMLRAEERLRQLLFEEEHPNFRGSFAVRSRHLRRTSVDDIREFHARVFGPEEMIIVAVGDVDSDEFVAELDRAFRGWRGGLPVPDPLANARHGRDREVRVKLVGRPSLNVRWGVATGLRRTDPDFPPVFLGTSILGGSFSARLMSAVRDDEGLTYGIYAFTDGDRIADGFWQVTATFAPQLLEQGMASTRREIQRWVDEGVSGAELEEHRDLLVGSFQVELSTSRGMADQLLTILERGHGPEYLDQHPQRLRAVTLDQVNAAIRRYIKPEEMIVVVAGDP